MKKWELTYKGITIETDLTGTAKITAYKNFEFIGEFKGTYPQMLDKIKEIAGTDAMKYLDTWLFA